MPTPLEDVQEEILAKLHAGETVDRDAVLAANPEHTAALRRFFDVLDAIEGAPPADAGGPSNLGEFRIVREVGRGGMGIVYEAEQASLKRRVALKVLPPEVAEQPRLVARFRREAEAAGRLRHPNIVPVYSVGEAKGRPFFAMELVEGRPLSDVISERRAGRDADLPAAGEPWRRWVVAMIAKVADGLGYAHGQGILHRDVKPANILLEKDGTPRLMDFGLALDLGAPGLTAAGETFGTPLYMSPEQALRREMPLDPRTDVYSLGVTLYEALTLRPPYVGLSAMEVFAALRSGKIVPPREVDPSMRPELESVVLRALEREPSARYPSAAALATDLRAVLEERAVTAPPAPRRRRRIARWALVGAAFGAVPLAITLLLLKGGAPTATPTRDAATISTAPKRDLGGTPWPLVTPDGAPKDVRVSQQQIDEAKRLGVPAWFENSIGMRFVLIPAGRFVMGSPTSEKFHQEEEAQHEVVLDRALYVQTTETTNAQYRRVKPEHHTPAYLVPLDDDGQPVGDVTRDDAKAFAESISRDGRRYRLPSEQEWEYACRAGTTTSNFWGDDVEETGKYGNVADRTAKARWSDFRTMETTDGFAGAAPVGSYLPNPWGLLDTIGNVNELVIPRSGDAHVRGGCWNAYPEFCRSAAGNFLNSPDSKGFSFGFRVVAELPAPAKRDLGETPWPLVTPDGAPKDVRVSQRQIDEAKRLGVPVWFDNALGMRFVLIPAGKFLMGSPKDEPMRDETGEDQREVEIARAFYLAVHETTNREVRAWNPMHHTTPPESSDVDRDELPVAWTTIADARTFAAHVSKKDGRAYRVPTEEEWEYACRAGTSGAWFWGDDPRDAPRFANVCDRRARTINARYQVIDVDDGFAVAAPPGSFLPNPWGLFDMIGNVAERVEAPGARRSRAAKGGGWVSMPAQTRTAYTTTYAADDTIWTDVGFRLACDVPTSPPKRDLGETPWPLVTPDGAPRDVRVSQRQLDEAKRLDVPVWFENSAGMRFVLIPAGKFVMGSPPSERGHGEDEVQRETSIADALYVQTTEVTNGQFRRLVPSHHTPSAQGTSLDGDDLPAGNMGVAGASAYAALLATRDGRAYRLPSETEWEYACRAGTTTSAFWGDDLKAAGRYANVQDLAAQRARPSWTEVVDTDDGFFGASPAGTYLPNPWGLFDTIGNVWEFTRSEHDGDPTIVRGSGYAALTISVRAAQRFVVGDEKQGFLFGFRLVADLPEKR